MTRLAAVCLVFALLLASLAGCVALPAPAVAPPAPAGLVISDGGNEIRIKPGDTAYAALAKSLAELVAALDTPLYASYPPARVADEILVRPHLQADYSPQATLKGKGYEAEASQLIVAMTGEGPVVLTRVGEGADWTASEASDAGLFESLFRVVRDQTGIDLSAEVK